MTNADRLRAMTDEELAEWLQNAADCRCPLAHCVHDCKKCWLVWLGHEEGIYGEY